MAVKQFKRFLKRNENDVIPDMSGFSKIEYPTCPECLTLINDLRIFDLWSLECQRYFHKKTCHSCKKVFLMKTRAELLTEVIRVEE